MKFLSSFSPFVQKAIIGTVIVSLSYGGYAIFFKKSTSGTNYTAITTTVKKGNIENSVQVIGTSALVYEQKMQFSQGGKVAKIFFKEGDKVKQGDIMAELDTTDVLNDIKQQEVNLSNAQIKLSELLKGATDKDILNAENSVASAISKITTLENDRVNIFREKANKQTDYDNQIVSKQNDIQSKQAQLTNSQNELITLEKTQNKGLTDIGTNIAKTLDSAIIDARKQIIDADANLYSADEILGISDANRTKNDNYEVYFSAKNSTLKFQTENDWAKATTLLSQTKSLLNNLSSGSSDTAGVKNLLSTLAQMESALVTLGKNGTDAMNASIVSSSFPQSTIDSYANIFSSITSSSQSSLSAVNNTIANIATLTDPTLQQASINDALNTKKQSVSDQKYTLEQAQRDLIKLQNDKIYSSDTYDSQIVSQDNSIRDAKNALKYAQASLDLLKAGATQTEIALAKNSITSGQISLQKVKEGITKYQLEAPFDGVVRKIDFKLGDNIVTSSSSTIAYLYIENPNLVEITATVDQLEVVKLKLGQDAKIVFDSFSTLTFTGKVSDINSTPTQTSGVTTYTIKVAMDKGNNPIFSGMSAKVDIIIEAKNDTLIVGTSFIEKKNGKTAVLKKNGISNVRTNIVTGISNPTNTEILSGVSEGDTIVRLVATGTGASTKTSLIPTGGGANRGVSGGSSNRGM